MQVAVESTTYEIFKVVIRHCPEFIGRHIKIVLHREVLVKLDGTVAIESHHRGIIGTCSILITVYLLVEGSQLSI